MFCCHKDLFVSYNNHISFLLIYDTNALQNLSDKSRFCDKKTLKYFCQIKTFLQKYLEGPIAQWVKSCLCKLRCYKSFEEILDPLGVFFLQCLFFRDS